FFNCCFNFLGGIAGDSLGNWQTVLGKQLLALIFMKIHVVYRLFCLIRASLKGEMPQTLDQQGNYSMPCPLCTPIGIAAKLLLTVSPSTLSGAMNEYCYQISAPIPKSCSV